MSRFGARWPLEAGCGFVRGMTSKAWEGGLNADLGMFLPRLGHRDSDDLIPSSVAISLPATLFLAKLKEHVILNQSKWECFFQGQC